MTLLTKTLIITTIILASVGTASAIFEVQTPTITADVFGNCPATVPVTTVSPLDQIVSFLQSDNTNDHKFVATGIDNYVCASFAVDLAVNLSSAGYESGVYVRSAKYDNGTGHIQVWCTVDNTTFIIEPQNDGVIDSNVDTEHKTEYTDSYVYRYESIESGSRKATQMYQRLL